MYYHATIPYHRTILKYHHIHVHLIAPSAKSLVSLHMTMKNSFTFDNEQS